MGHEAAARLAAETALAARITSGPPILDAYGRRVVIGGHYSYHAQFPIPVQVVDIVPVLDPHAAPGTHLVTVQAQVQIQVMERSPVRVLQLIALPRVAQPVDPGKAEGDAATNGDGGTNSEARPPTPGIVLTDV